MPVFAIKKKRYFLTGGSVAPASYANRVDLSVNGGFVENFQEVGAIFRTKTNVNPVGGYNGGGIGNKAILGNYGFDGLLLSALTSLSWRSKNLTPQNIQPPVQQFMNLQVELDPVNYAGVYAIFALLNANPGPLQQGVVTTPAPNETEVTWNAATDYTQVVVDRGMFLSSAPIPWPGPGTFNAANLGVGAGDPPVGAWPARSYKWSSIVAAFPNACIRNANTNDGGLPRNTITAGVLLVSGDSGTVIIHERRLISWKLNGAEI